MPPDSDGLEQDSSLKAGSKRARSFAGNSARSMKRRKRRASSDRAAAKAVDADAQLQELSTGISAEDVLLAAIAGSAAGAIGAATAAAKL